MNQKEINKLWERGNRSVISLSQPDQGETGLKAPYQFKVHARTASDLASILRQWVDGRGLQCNLIKSKPTTYGIRLSVFLLGYTHGLCGDDSKGIDAEDWENVTEKVTQMLKDNLGENVLPYVDEWSDDQKFQMRWEGYIMFRELEPKPKKK